MGGPNHMHTALERHIVPKIRVGVQISLIGAALLLFFVPRYGILGNMVLRQICWILTALGAALLALGAFVVLYLPRYYRRISRIVREGSPQRMLVTLKRERLPDGNACIYAELRPESSEPVEPAVAVVSVLDPPSVPPHSPAEVYMPPKRGPIVISTPHGILWPSPDRDQQKLERIFRAR